MLIAHWWGAHVHFLRDAFGSSIQTISKRVSNEVTRWTISFVRHTMVNKSPYTMYKGYGNVPNESQFGRDELNGVPENGHDRRQQPHRHTQQYDTTESCRFLMFRNERRWKCAGIGLDFVQR